MNFRIIFNKLGSLSPSGVDKEPFSCNRVYNLQNFENQVLQNQWINKTFKFEFDLKDIFNEYFKIKNYIINYEQIEKFALFEKFDYECE